MPKKRDANVPKRPAHRPLKEINVELLKRMAARHSTMEEMAACLGCHVDTLRDRYSDLIESERSRGKLGIRDRQFQIMEKDWAPASQMAIWLGRVILGQNPDAGGLSVQQTSALTEFTDSIDRAREAEAQKEETGNGESSS